MKKRGKKKIAGGIEKGEFISNVQKNERSSLLVYILLGVLLILLIAFVIIYFISEEVLPAPTEGLVLEYLLNEGSGTAIHDSSGQGNDGSLSGGQENWVRAIDGKGLDLNGVNNYVEVADDLSLRPVSGISVLSWVYLKQMPSSAADYVFDKADVVSGNYSGYSLVFNSGNMIFFAYTNGNNKDASVSFDYSHRAGQWHLVAGVYNGTNSLIYVDGVEVGRISKTGEMEHNTQRLTIGSINDGTVPTGGYLNGTIDNSRVYNRALNSSEISGIFNDERLGLVANYTFNETGNVVVDYAYGNNGSISAGVARVRGVSGNALSFNGSAVVDFADSDVLDLSSLTIELWVKPNTIGLGDTFVAKRLNNGNTINYLFQIDSAAPGELDFIYRADDDFRYFTTTNANLEVGKWQHLVATYDYNRANEVKVYKNGVLLAGNFVNMDNKHWMESNNEPLRLGYSQRSDGIKNYFNGVMDSVRIYGYSLDNETILRDYNYEGPKYIANYTFNALDGADDSAYGNTATLTNAAMASGVKGNAINLSGNGYARITNITAINNISLFSYTLWIKRSGIAPSTMGLLYKGANAQILNIISENWGELHSELGNAVATTNGTCIVNDTNWHFVGVTYDSDSKIRIYIDGKEGGYSAQISGARANDAAADLYVGSKGATNYFSGIIDDLKIYDRVLSPAEILAEYMTADFVSPYIAFASPTPANGSIVSLSRSVTINITNNSDAVYVWWNNGTATLHYTGPVVISNLADGSYTFTAYANDSLGNTNSTSVTFRMQKDVTPPAVGITLLPFAEGNVYTNTNSINVTISASDASGISSLNWWNNTANNTIPSPYSYSIILNLSVNGDYKLWAHAVDNAGNSNYVNVNLSVSYDAGDLHIRIISPEQNKSYSSNITSIKVASLDKNLSYCNVSFDNFATSYNASKINNTLFNFTKELSDGNYTVKAVCKDVFGMFASASLIFSVDTHAPVVKLISPKDEDDFTARSNVIFKFNVSDASSISDCRLVIDNEEENSTDSVTRNVNISLSWSGSSRYETGYDCTVECVDAAGNIGSSSEITVNLECPSGETACGTSNECKTTCCLAGQTLCSDGLCRASCNTGGNTGTGAGGAGGATCTSTCTTSDYNCGMHTFCGALRSCGNCTAGNSCISGRCTPNADSCQDTCASKGYSCGEWSICGSLQNCGSCGDNQECSASGICEAKGNTSFWLIVVLLLVPILVLIVVIVIIIMRERKKKAVLNGVNKPSPQNLQSRPGNAPGPSGFVPRAPF